MYVERSIGSAKPSIGPVSRPGAIRECVVVALGIATLGANHVHASDDSQSAGDTLEEITVTANKVAEPLNRVPESIGVLTAAQVSQSGTVDLQGIVNRVPGLSANIGGAPGTGSVTVRGIAQGGGNSTTTGMYIDDVSINFGNFLFAGAFEPALFDLERVEVLRGPQGTLYGAESFGGTIRYVSRKANLSEFEGDTTVSAYQQDAGDPGAAVSGAVSLPFIVDKLALRVAGTYQHDGGFVDHVGPDGTITARDTNSQKVYALRTTLEWRPVENISVSPTFQYQETRNDDTWNYDVTRGEFLTPRRIEEPLRDRFALWALNSVFTFDRHELTSVTSYVNRKSRRFQDYTIYDMGFIGPVVAYYFDPDGATDAAEVLPSVLTVADHPNNNEQWSQELRLASDFDALGVRTLFGLYYNHEERAHLVSEDAADLTNQTMRLFGLTANEALAEAFGIPPAAANLGNILYAEDTLLTFNRRAAYGDISWEPSAVEGLKFTAGLRYSSISYSKLGYLDGFFSGGFHSIEQSFGETQAAPKFKVAYQRNSDELYYVSASKGFRLGGPNFELPVSCDAEVAQSGLTPTSSYATDSIWSYEVGGKVGLLGRRMQINASAFHIDWTDIAQSIAFPRCGFSFNTNFGDASSDGVDVSVQLRLGGGFDLSLGVAYTDAKFLTAVPLAGIEKNGKIPFSPPWTASIDIGYEWPTGSGSIYARANAAYSDQSLGALRVGQEIFVRPSYTSVGLVGGYRFDFLDVSLFVRNLTNEHPSLTQTTTLGYLDVYTLRPRQFGIMAQTSF